MCVIHLYLLSDSWVRGTRCLVLLLKPRGSSLGARILAMYKKHDILCFAKAWGGLGLGILHEKRLSPGLNPACQEPIRIHISYWKEASPEKPAEYPKFRSNFYLTLKPLTVRRRVVFGLIAAVVTWHNYPIVPNSPPNQSSVVQL
jgi:hypothetical protein